eukprot:CAMPEP_0206294482 /NCGR_PEP_ID=MMETSP0106_2-20121207/4681_1 /ASSEMBLY_ACC=CAM_ASM_000206 /TAXON_ID=81532 /ORGANISM="Acanthoeca-like sp., Strain 10tr" /LENGTH=47 /DNA_ID= /DNA_START= /DNA_END= /DNA_ORIENTATION=
MTQEPPPMTQNLSRHRLAARSERGEEDHTHALTAPNADSPATPTASE